MVVGVAVTVGLGGADPTLEDATVDPVGQSPGAWELAFSDEFDGSDLNTGVWATCFWWQRGGCTNLSTNERQWYTPDQVFLDDGALVLEADVGPAIGLDGREFPYVSGIVTTGRNSPDRSAPPGFSFQYGYVEMRARIPDGLGMWPAFWLLPTTHDPKPEIDVMEILGDRPDRLLMHIHWRDPARTDRQTGSTWIGPDFSEDWHVFAVRWTAEAVTWFVDGIERWRFRQPASIPHEPMYLLANLAVGGSYAGDPDDPAIFPARYTIDYIRVWQEAD